MARAVPRSLKERLDHLAEFLPVFEAPEFSFGSWGGGEVAPDGTIQVPFFSLSRPASAFVDMAYDWGWVEPQLNWPDWRDSPEAVELLSGPEGLASATPEQLAKVLTVVIRQDRFVEGLLSSAFNSGLLLAVLRRAEVLRHEVTASGS